MNIRNDLCCVVIAVEKLVLIALNVNLRVGVIVAMNPTNADVVVTRLRAATAMNVCAPPISPMILQSYVWLLGMVVLASLITADAMRLIAWLALGMI